MRVVAFADTVIPGVPVRPSGGAMNDPQQQRERMVQRQVAARGVRDHYTLEAMRQVPRDWQSLDLPRFLYRGPRGPLT